MLPLPLPPPKPAQPSAALCSPQPGSAAAPPRLFPPRSGPARLRHRPRSAGADAATAAVSGRGSAGPRLLPQPADRPSGGQLGLEPQRAPPSQGQGQPGPQGPRLLPSQQGPALQNCPSRLPK
ncbi:hypothetical protein NN561_002832 [Cricetulus griseus]